MKIIIALLLYLLSSNVAKAEFRHINEWSNKEKIEFSAFVALSYTDYRQARWALEQKDNEGRYMYSEINPLLGKRPNNSMLILSNLIGTGVYYYCTGNDTEICRNTKKTLFGLRVVTIIYHKHIGIQFSKAF